jgi:hypothetical protein
MRRGLACQPVSAILRYKSNDKPCGLVRLIVTTVKSLVIQTGLSLAVQELSSKVVFSHRKGWGPERGTERFCISARIK